MEALTFFAAFCTVNSVLVVQSASIQQDNCNPPFYTFSGVSAGVLLPSGPSGGGTPPTKNPWVNKPTPASKLTFKFTEEELNCKKAERDSLQKDIWMFEIR